MVSKLIKELWNRQGFGSLGNKMHTRWIQISSASLVQVTELQQEHHLHVPQFPYHKNQII